jgi:hypothetical protein
MMNSKLVGGWNGRHLVQVVSLLLTFLLAAAAHALVPLNDDELSRQSGAGIAIALQDIDFLMAPTSYIEATPSSTNLPAGYYPADLRWYGWSMTGDTGTNGQWYGGYVSGSGGCAAITGANNICPLTNAPIADFASVYNPFVLRVFNYAGYNYAGTLLTQGSSGTAPTVLELRGPTASDTWRWSFWGALTVNANTPTVGSPTSSTLATGVCTSTTFCGLQSQVIIEGKPIARVDSTYGTYSTGVATPTVVQYFTIPNVSDNYSTSDSTLGIVYNSSLSGNFRFGVEKYTGSNETGARLTDVPNFDPQEGMYFKDVNAFLPLGHLNDQAITFSAAGTSGNFVMELTRVPNVAAAYNDIYCNGSCVVGTGINNGPGGGLCSTGVICNPNPATHGFVDWGTTAGMTTGAASGAAGTNYNDISATNTTEGIYFNSPTSGQASAGTAGTVVNIGTAHIDGVLFQHLMITSCGAGASSIC